jgi:hypothetical protein
MFVRMPPTEAPNTRPSPKNAPEPENQSSASDFFALPDNVASRAIREFAGMPLRWVPLKANFWRQTYELRCGEEVLGLMHWESYFLSTRGLARTKEGTWSFRGNRYEVAIETDKEVRTLVRLDGWRPSLMPPFRLIPWGAMLSLPNGHVYFFKPWGVFTISYRWLGGAPLITASLRQPFMTPSTGGDVEVHPPAAALPELDLLIALGLYFALGTR